MHCKRHIHFLHFFATPEVTFDTPWPLPMFEKRAAPLSLRYGSAAITAIIDHARSVLEAVSAHVHANEQTRSVLVVTLMNGR